MPKSKPSFLADVEAKLYVLRWVPSLREMSRILKADGKPVSHIVVCSCYDYLATEDDLLLDTKASPKWVMNPKYIKFD